MYSKEEIENMCLFNKHDINEIKSKIKELTYEIKLVKKDALDKNEMTGVMVRLEELNKLNPKDLASKFKSLFTNKINHFEKVVY